jgi:hypothetical protein
MLKSSRVTSWVALHGCYNTILHNTKKWHGEHHKLQQKMNMNYIEDDLHQKTNKKVMMNEFTIKDDNDSELHCIVITT